MTGLSSTMNSAPFCFPRSDTTSLPASCIICRRCARSRRLPCRPITVCVRMAGLPCGPMWQRWIAARRCGSARCTAAIRSSAGGNSMWSFELPMPRRARISRLRCWYRRESMAFESGARSMPITRSRCPTASVRLSHSSKTLRRRLNGSEPTCSLPTCCSNGQKSKPSRTWKKARSAAAMPKFTDYSGASRDTAHHELLAPDEPHPVLEIGGAGRSNFVIVVDHASRRIPRRLGDLGLPPDELERHIAWDIGALGVAKRVAEALDAPLVAQNYSRLVIDCNRDPSVATSIPMVGESIEIPGNISLAAEQARARRPGIFDPYHQHLRALFDARQAAGRPTILVAQHSMTNIFKGVTREMHAAVLYNRDRRFAGLVLDMLRRDGELLIADNEPYFVSDETDYTIPRHGEARGLPHVEIEIRQDLVNEAAGQAQWARRIAGALRDAEQAFLGASR